MRFSSYNMEGRIKSKTKFINEGVAECFNSVKYNNHYMLIFRRYIYGIKRFKNRG